MEKTKDRLTREEITALAIRFMKHFKVEPNALLVCKEKGEYLLGTKEFNYGAYEDETETYAKLTVYKTNKEGALKLGIMCDENYFKEIEKEEMEIVTKDT